MNFTKFYEKLHEIDNIFSISLVFQGTWQNHMLAPPLEGLCPLLWGILDLPLVKVIKNVIVL